MFAKVNVTGMMCVNTRRKNVRGVAAAAELFPATVIVWILWKTIVKNWSIRRMSATGVKMLMTVENGIISIWQAVRIVSINVY